MSASSGDAKDTKDTKHPKPPPRLELVPLPGVPSVAPGDDLARLFTEAAARAGIALEDGVLICETKHGFVCANAGVDLSNSTGDDIAVLLPVDPDASAARLRADLEALGARNVAVVVSDTFGRPWREGLVDVALGSAGIEPIRDLRGTPDLAGRELQVTATATCDQLAAAAGLLMLKEAAIPAVWVSGLVPEGDGRVADTLRESQTDLFR